MMHITPSVHFDQAELQLIPVILQSFLLLEWEGADVNCSNPRTGGKGQQLKRSVMESH